MQSRALSEYQEEVKRTQVLVFAGGLAKRMGSDRPKALVEVAGQSLIDRSVNSYANCGFAEFVFLLGHGHEEISRHIGDGRKHGIKPVFSMDPDIPSLGKGKSLRHALETGKVDPSKRSLVAFPDDVFTDPFIPMKVLLEHLYGVRTFGAVASAVITRGRKWSYGVAELDEKGLVKRFEEKPFVSLLTAVGIYLFEPGAYKVVPETIDMNSKDPVEFEKALLPELAKRGLVYSIMIPSESWLPINTQKEREEAEKVISRSASKWEFHPVPVNLTE